MPGPDRGTLATHQSLATNQSVFASTSVARQLTRGAIGFGLIGSAVALVPSAGPAALLLAAPGMVALRGCPTCWIVGLIQTVTAGRLQRACTDTSCTLQIRHPDNQPRDNP